MAIKTVIQFRKGNLSAWQNVNPILMDGEIVLVDKNNGLGEKSWMIRVGDGTTNFNGLPDLAYILDDELSSNISGVVKDIQDLSAAMPEIFIDDEKSQSLKLKRLSQEEYANLLISGLVEPDCVYLVSSTVQYNYGERIVDVGEAVESADALPKWQIERDFASKGDISDFISSESDPIFKSLSGNFYLKNETSSATQISTALDGKQPKGNYLTAESDPVFSSLSGNFLTSHQSLDGYLQKLSSGQSLDALANNNGGEITEKKKWFGGFRVRESASNLNNYTEYRRHSILHVANDISTYYTFDDTNEGIVNRGTLTSNAISRRSGKSSTEPGAITEWVLNNDGFGGIFINKTQNGTTDYSVIAYGGFTARRNNESQNFLYENNANNEGIVRFKDLKLSVETLTGGLEALSTLMVSTDNLLTTLLSADLAI